MGWIITTTECCGSICAKITHSETFERFWMHDEKAWWQWAQEEDDKKGRKIKWLAWLKMLLKKLKDMIDEGILSQSEAEQMLKDWLKDNPDPLPDGIDVSEEFTKMPIPVRIPVPAEREA